MVTRSYPRTPLAPWGAVTCGAAPDPLRVSLVGEIDIALEENLGAVARFLSGSARSDIAVCLHDVTFLDSTGLEFLLHVQEHVRSTGRTLRIVAPSAAARWVLQVAGLADCFEVEDATGPDCACRVPRIDGILPMVPTQRRRGLEGTSN
jgi:anti-anti-sigma factor